jgi:hypothetical protein
MMYIVSDVSAKEDAMPSEQTVYADQAGMIEHWRTFRA